MPNHIAELDKKITALSDALAHLGKGTDLKELLRIIRNPGWTTPAEFAFTLTILDSMQDQVKQLGRMSGHLLEAGKLVSSKHIAENA
jgi:hypothetical protein